MLVQLNVANLILEEVVADMEDANTLFVVTLDCQAREKHVSHLSEGQGRVRVNEVNFSWSHIDVPLCEVGAHENKEVNNVGKTQWNTREKNSKEAHAFLNVVLSVDDHIFNDELLELWHVEEVGVTGQVDGEASEAAVEHWPPNQDYSNALLVGLVEGSLSLYKALQFLIGLALQWILGVFVHTPHALVSNIEHQTDYFWTMS